jgi:hypothetical protein
MTLKNILQNKKDRNRRLFYFEDRIVAVYSSPERILPNRDLKYNVDIIEPPLGKKEVIIKNEVSQNRLKNNLHTKDLVARICFNDIFQKDCLDRKLNYPYRK